MSEIVCDSTWLIKTVQLGTESFVAISHTEVVAEIETQRKQTEIDEVDICI